MSETRVVGRRVLAYVADAVFVVGCVLALQRISRSTAERGLVSGLTFAGVVAVPYHVVLEGTTGQTVGKRVFDIAVERENGDPCTVRDAAIRTVARVVDWLPVAYLAGFIAIALTDRDQRLGDLAAGTVVVRPDRDGDGDGG